MQKVILIGNDGDLGLRHNTKYQKKFEGATIRSKSSVENDKRFNAKPEVGMVFIKHPYLDKYLLNNQDLELNIYKESISAVFNLAQKLGAIRCEYELSVEERRFLGIKAKGKVSSPIGDGEAKVEGHTDNHFWQGLKMVYQNRRIDDSDTISEAEFEEAKRYFDSCEYLKRSPQAKNMLDMRNPASRTQRTYESLSYSLGENINEELAVAAKLRTAGNVVRVKGDYSQKKQINRSVRATYKIWFKEDGQTQ